VPWCWQHWSLSSLNEKLIKIGAKVISHGRSVAFQMAEVAITRQMFHEILRVIAELLPKPRPAPASDRRCSCVREHLTGVLRPDTKENRSNRAPGVTFGDPTEGDGQESSQTFRIAAPNPTLPVRDHIRGAKPRRQRPASGRTVVRHHCTINMYLINMYLSHVLAARRRHRQYGL